MAKSATLPVAGVSGCCPDGLSQPLQRGAAASLAVMFEALADPACVQLMALIASAETGERCACDFTDPIGLSQPTVSHHLKIPTEAGLLNASNVAPGHGSRWCRSGSRSWPPSWMISSAVPAPPTKGAAVADVTATSQPLAVLQRLSRVGSPLPTAAGLQATR